MSDKFDKDDFSWLDDNDNNNQNQDDDFPDLDWLTDVEDDAPKRDERRLGVTGELPWLSDTDTPAEEESDDAFDWSKSSTKQSQSPDDRRLGVTGELSWLGGSDDETETPSTPRSGATGQLDWRKSNFEDQLEAAERAAGVDWGRDASDDNTFEIEDDEEVVESDIPEWLRGAEPVDKELASFADAFEGTSTAQNEDDSLPDWMSGETFEEDETDLVEEELDTDLVPPAWMVDVPDDINESPSWLTGVTRSAEISEDDLATEDGLSNLFGDDLFTELDTPTAEEADDFDLLAELTSNQGSTGLTDLLNSSVVETPDTITVEAEEDDDLDWLRDFEPEAPVSAPPAANRQTEIQDVDDFFASLESGPLEFDENLDDLTNTEVEFDDLFADPTLNEAAPAQPQTPDTFRPDWLSNVSISEVSAAAIVRKQQDRPLEELPERLQLLHEEGLNLPTASPTPPANPEIGQLIPDLRDALPPAPVRVSASTIAENLVLTPDQTRKVGILTNLSASSAAAAEALLTDQPEARPRRRFAVRLDRLLMTALIALSVILPFFGIARIGNLPPSTMVAGSRQEAAFEQVNNLNSGDLVLFAAEYGATSAGELDTYTDALLRHTILRGARPVIVSSNPVGLLRADNRASAIANGALTRNQDYYVGRYIVGSTIGMRSFSQDITSLTSLDVQGRATGLEITSLDDFTLIVVIVESSESIRTWAEQVAPLTTAPILFASSYAASPLALPYESVTQGGLLVGYEDAYTYAQMVDEIAADAPPIVLPTETPTDERTEEPTVVLTEEASPTATGEITVTATEEAEASPTVTEEPTEEILPAVEATTQVSPSPTLEPTIAETEEPTEASTAAPTETEEPQDEDVFGTVSAQQAVNVREGPGRDFTVVGVLQPGDRVPVRGANEDNSWYNIRLEDGTEGWISAPLLELERELPEAQLVPPSSRGMALNISYRRVAQATEEPDLQETPEVITADFTTTIPYRDERWYGMTLGLITIVVIIAIGNLLSVIRRRRGR